MAQKVSMTDIARRLNVSQATVSYVLNGRQGSLVSEGTRERVLEMAREMGYRRNRAAQALAGQRSYLIELCVYGFYPPFYARALQEFERHIAPTPYQLHIVSPSHWNEKDWENTDGGWPVDGIIIFDAVLPESMLADLKQRGVPIVSVGIYPGLDLDHVKIDLSPALYEAAHYLAARCKRVAFLSPWPVESGSWESDPRYPAYSAALKKAGLPEEVVIVPDRNGLENRIASRQIIREYIQKNGCPDAIFCFNDERAIAALAALRDLNLRVPDDVLLIGCDGIEETAYHSPPISTIEYPIEETARLSWEFLKRRLEEPDIPLQSAVLTAQFLQRESSTR